MDSNQNFDLDRKVARLIRRKARILSRSFGFQLGDEEDIRQELAAHILERLRRYDPSRGSPITYVDLLPDDKAADMVRYVLAQKRNRDREEPDDGVPESDREELGDRAWSAERIERRLDVWEALAGLPEDLREIAGLLMVFNQAEVSRMTRLSREQIRRMVRRIARHLRQRGISE